MRTLRHLAAGAVCAALLLAGCGEPEEPGVIRVSGHVEATDVRLAVALGGRLERFDLALGDRVESGQEVARLDATQLARALDAARADRELAEAELRLLLAGFRREDVAQATAQVERAEVEVAAAERDLERFRGLYESGSGTEKQVDDARTRRDAAAKSLEAAREQLLKLSRGFRSEEIDAARARVRAAEARIAQAEARLADATVVAPRSGVVTEKLVEAGEVVAPGSALAVVDDLSEVKLVAYLGEPALGKVRLGQEAEVVTDGGERRTGRLVYVSDRAEFTPKNVQTHDERVKLVYEIKIALDNADGVFKPGMPAEATFRSAGAPPEPSKPPEASGAGGEPEGRAEGGER